MKTSTVPGASFPVSSSVEPQETFSSRQGKRVDDEKRALESKPRYKEEKEEGKKSGTI